MNLGKPILFSTSEYGYLKAQMLKSRRFVDGQIARSVARDGTANLADVPFPDGERYHRLLTDVVDREVILVGGTVSDRATMELLDIGTGLVMEGAARLKLVLPYFGYATMERAILPAELVKAKIRAMQLSAIPRGAMANWAYMLDLHSEGIPSYFENGVITRHIYAKSLVISAVEAAARSWQRTSSHKLSDGSTCGGELGTKLRVRQLNCHAPNVDDVLSGTGDFKLNDFTVASTDAGRAKWVESLCRDMVKLKLPVHPAFIIKRRISGSETVVADISADVKGKLVVIYDDMIRTGGSAIAAAKAYLAKGALAVILISTHGVLPGDSKQKLRDSGCFHSVIVSDSHPRAVELADDFLHVIPTAQLLVDSVLGAKGK
ncbi:MAG: ribose-phosphate pyrophosphokinase-like domain-containing protein [Candidatus Melainabacteria bacterium]|nr:ribose-phosphate pyrophosphokinase-like domain-containing protein [Candidatus Melainabacteria bacterium]